MARMSVADPIVVDVAFNTAGLTNTISTGQYSHVFTDPESGGEYRVWFNVTGQSGTEGQLTGVRWAVGGNHEFRSDLGWSTLYQVTYDRAQWLSGPPESLEVTPGFDGFVSFRLYRVTEVFDEVEINGVRITGPQPNQYWPVAGLPDTITVEHIYDNIPEEEYSSLSANRLEAQFTMVPYEPDPVVVEVQFNTAGLISTTSTGQYTHVFTDPYFGAEYQVWFDVTGQSGETEGVRWDGSGNHEFRSDFEWTTLYQATFDRAERLAGPAGAEEWLPRFDGFVSINLFRVTESWDEVELNGVRITGPQPTQHWPVEGLPPMLAVEHIYDNIPEGEFSSLSANRLRAQFTVVREIPEPSLLGLLVVGGLVWLRRIRKR